MNLHDVDNVPVASKDTDRGSHSFIRHRIPYRLLGRRALSAKRLVVSSKVLFPAIPTQNCDVVLTFPSDTEDETLLWLLARLKSRAPNIRVQVRHHSHTGIYGFYLTASYESLLQGAEELGILKPLKSEYGGGMKEFVFEDQDCFAEIENESSFLTSQERQIIVLHFLNELRATSDDTLNGISFIEGQPIVPLLITKKVVLQLFPLHHNADLKVLRKGWVQAIFSQQPLDLVCQYFGVKVSLYFAYLGHYTTWLLLPTLLGLFMFLYQGLDQWIDDLFFIGFALFNSLWSTLYLKFWVRTSTSYCYKWGTLQKKDELLKDARPLFEGYTVKSPITGQLELSYPPWRRLLFLNFITVPIIALCLAFVFVIMLLCFELQELVNSLIEDEELPYIFSFVPKVLLGVVVTILDEVYKKIAIWLTNKENYRLEESHETGLILKLVLFQFVNSFLSLFYIGFYLRDMDRLRDQLAALLITRQVLGNLKEAFMPYIIWKARLYSVGYKLATRMSPDSLDKEVERMSTQISKHSTKETSLEGDTVKSNEKSSDKQSGPEDEDVVDESIPTLTQAEVESEMKKYDGTLEDYLEMVIQFGYVTLFSSAFPLAALCALLNNFIEIRSDAFKLCITHQRPFGQPAENIGIWQDILCFMSILAVTVNCALISTSGILHRFFPDLSTTLYCIIFIAIEHTLITGKFILYRFIPDLPKTVAQQMAKLEYQRTEALKQLLVSQAANNPGGMSLSSQQSGTPGSRRRKLVEHSSSNRDVSPPPPIPKDNNEYSTPSMMATPVSLTQRPSDFYTPPQTPGNQVCRSRLDAYDTPPVPPIRKSLLKNDAVLSRSHENFNLSNLADSLVTASVNPALETAANYRDKSSSATSDQYATTYTQAAVLPPSGRSSASVAASTSGMRGQPSEILKRVYRRRMDSEAWRRRSEPVSSAVRQAVNQYTESGKTDERTARNDGESFGDDGFRHTRSFSLREEIRRSKEKMHTLDKPRSGIGEESDAVSSSCTKGSSLSSLCLTSAIPPPAASTGLKYCGSPMLKNRSGHVVGGRSLSKQLRSFSSTDMTEVKPSFRDRLSWKGELSIVNSSDKQNVKECERDKESAVRPIESTSEKNSLLHDHAGSDDSVSQIL